MVTPFRGNLSEGVSGAYDGAQGELVFVDLWESIEVGGAII